jgi:type I restriction enzyme, S subunit
MDWPSLELKDLVEPSRGISYGIVQPGSPTPNGVPIVRVSDVRNGRISISDPLRVAPEIESQYSRTRLRGGELLLTIVGTVGETAIVPETLAGWNTARAIAVIPVRKDVGAYWVRLALRAPAVRSMIDSRLNTTVQATLNLGDVARLPILLPPEPERKRIIHVLQALDNKIELNRQMNETLELTARALFKDWFVDFGPTRAKMEGGAPYLSAKVWSLFPDRLDGNGKPVGWKTGCLDDLLVLQRGFDLPNDKRNPGPYVVMAASGPNGFHSKYMVSGPGITTGRSGVLGKVFFIHEDFWPLNTSLWVKQFKASTPVYAYFLLRDLDLASFNAGSAVPTLNRNHVHKLQLTVPSKPAIMAFDERVMPLFKRQRMNELESETLIATRDLLLPKLMSGEICLRDAEKLARKVS